jgi:hypothetical protein
MIGQPGKNYCPILDNLKKVGTPMPAIRGFAALLNDRGPRFVLYDSPSGGILFIVSIEKWLELR